MQNPDPDNIPQNVWEYYEQYGINMTLIQIRGSIKSMLFTVEVLNLIEKGNKDASLN